MLTKMEAGWPHEARSSEDEDGGSAVRGGRRGPREINGGRVVCRGEKWMRTGGLDRTRHNGGRYIRVRGDDDGRRGYGDLGRKKLAASVVTDSRASAGDQAES